MNGWIKTHRELMEKSIWQLSTSDQRSILMALLLMANPLPKRWEWEGELYDAEPGQMVTSLENIAKNSGKGVSIQNVRTALLRFEKLGFLTNKSTKKGRLITICNWDTYQSNEIETNKEANSQLTVNQQSANSQLTSNRELENKRKKELKNKESESTRFAPPTLEEVESFFADKSYSQELAQKFFHHYEANGWMAGKVKMKKWTAAAFKWMAGSPDEAIRTIPIFTNSTTPNTFNSQEEYDACWK